MKVPDTNVVVRYLIGEPASQAAAARAVFESPDEVLLTDMTLAETACVLQSNYGVPRPVVVDHLQLLVGRTNIRVLDREKGVVIQALDYCRPSGRVSFADALIWAAARTSGGTVVTFDRRFPTDGVAAELLGARRPPLEKWMLLNGRVAVVTGGGRGIGAAICRVLARHGASVGVNYSSSGEKAEAVVADIVAAGGQAAAFQADVRNGAEAAGLVEAVHARFGRLDGVINNAIAGRQHGDFAEATDADFDTAFDFGCHAVVNTVRAARPIMREQGGGRIVNIVTELWNLSPAQWTVYMAGKGAMVGLSRSLANELGPENITVNMVAPGWMADEKVDTNSEGSKKFAASIPLRRHGSADEIGNACVFYLSDLAGYVTGTYLPVTGGRVTQAGV